MIEKKKPSWKDQARTVEDLLKRVGDDVFPTQEFVANQWVPVSVAYAEIKKLKEKKLNHEDGKVIEVWQDDHGKLTLLEIITVKEAWTMVGKGEAEIIHYRAVRVIEKEKKTK